MSATSATLLVHGLATTDEFERLARIIAKRTDRSEDDIRQALLAGEWLDLDEVCFGGMPKSLRECLGDICASYIWSWRSDDQIEPGLTIRDGTTHTERSFATSDDVVVVPVTRIHDAEYVAAAQEANKPVTGSYILHAYASQHELLRILEEHPEMRAFHDARTKALKESAEKAA